MGERDLLQQLELILETDPLIFELGFLHPTQFTSLIEDSGDQVPPQHASITKSANGDLDRDTSVFAAVQYDKSVFWCSNHRLAISLEVLPQLYSAAMHAYTYARRCYKEMINSPNAALEATSLHPYESEILKHTGVLLILSCDFTSAWNSRKLVLSKKHILSLFMDEFQLSKLILSNSPKSEYAWSHRRWIIKMIGEHSRDLQAIVEKESELVNEIAEKSKMNYRAWNHRCRLVPHMTKDQVRNELCKSRKWAEFHVADNCCFHYRRVASAVSMLVSDLTDASGVTPAQLDELVKGAPLGADVPKRIHDAEMRRQQSEYEDRLGALRANVVELKSAVKEKERQVAAKDEYVKKVEEAADKRISKLKDAREELHRFLSVSRGETSATEKELEKLQARFDQYQAFLTNEVPKIKRQCYRDCMTMFLKKIRHTYPSADVSYFSDVSDVPDVEVETEWLAAYAEAEADAAGENQTVADEEVADVAADAAVEVVAPEAAA